MRSRRAGKYRWCWGRCGGWAARRPSFSRRTLGELNDADIIAEAKRRFASFLKDPTSLAPSLREPVIRLAGENAGRQDYDALLALARRSISTEERVRFYSAAASARDPALARETLAVALADELPNVIRAGIINSVAMAGEQPELAWAFVKENFAALAGRQGPSFRDSFVANLMLAFSDASYADELARFAPVQATPAGRIMAARAQEAILIEAELKARVLPAIEDWLKGRTQRD
jgi:hypothetical protein